MLLITILIQNKLTSYLYSNKTSKTIPVDIIEQITESHYHKKFINKKDTGLKKKKKDTGLTSGINKKKCGPYNLKW